MVRQSLIVLLFGVLQSQCLLSAQNPKVDSLSTLLSRLSSEQSPEAKSLALTLITNNYPKAGPDLFNLAKSTSDITTKYLAIRGIGELKYKPATAFLIASLDDAHPYIRANAAGALGEMKAYSAKAELIRLLKGEKDGGVIEQTSHALQMVQATDAVPALRAVASHPSVQTRCWVLQAIGALGTKADVPFLAGFLDDDSPPVPMFAAEAIEKITGQDFGLPRQSGPGPVGSRYDKAVNNARRWWEANEKDWQY